MVERWNPIADMNRVMSEMDRLFSDSPARVRAAMRSREFHPSIDIYDSGDQLIVKALVPGATADDLDISLDRSTLSIKGRYGYVLPDDEAQNVTWYQREIGNGEWAESFGLPFPIDAERVEATVEDGVLTLQLPKSEESRVRRIPVSSPKSLNGRHDHE